jgi:hypothetical protein
MNVPASLETAEKAEVLGNKGFCFALRLLLQVGAKGIAVFYSYKQSTLIATWVAAWDGDRLIQFRLVGHSLCASLPSGDRREYSSAALMPTVVE